MPVTARLSQRFYERLGDDVANELVEWFNAVDATYQTDLRELNELNFARFDAKVEQRFAESDARFERRLAEFEVKFEKRLADLETKFERRLADLPSSLMTWIVGLWITSVLGFAGIVIALLRLR